MDVGLVASFFLASLKDYKGSTQLLRIAHQMVRAYNRTLFEACRRFVMLALGSLHILVVGFTAQGTGFLGLGSGLRVTKCFSEVRQLCFQKAATLFLKLGVEVQK